MDNDDVSSRHGEFIDCFMNIYFSNLYAILLFFSMIVRDWIDVPLLNSDDEDEEEQEVLKMSISPFFYCPVYHASNDFSDVVGIKNKCVSTHSKLYLINNIISTAMREKG